MSVLRKMSQDGTFNQTATLNSRLDHLFSFDLSSATDRFPLTFQEIVVRCLFGGAVSSAWVISGLGINMFQAPFNSKGGTT
jgi:hypothetical protein